MKRTHADHACHRLVYGLEVNTSSKIKLNNFGWLDLGSKTSVDMSKIARREHCLRMFVTGKFIGSVAKTDIRDL